MRIFLHSIGCRLNQSEIETIARQLSAVGHEVVPDPTQADGAVINTCAVTAAAARDARSMARRVLRENEEANLILTGCYATVSPEALNEIPGVNHVVANRDKDRVVQMIDPRIESDAPAFEREPVLRQRLQGTSGRTRAFIKVQDGCDNRCTFCITTIARGRAQSRPLGDVVAEVQALAQAGYQEAVLTGVHLGSYGHDISQNGGGRSLSQLVAAILEHSDIPRLRLSSLEPWDISPRFFSLWRNSRLLPHLHMPLQSGSDKILRRMARRTSRTSFRRLVDEARAHIPHLNLSTDIIAGFPGETDSDFADSLDYVRRIGFTRLHVFKYSPRPGTAAAKMPDQVPTQLKKERVQRMIELGKALSLKFHQGYEGKTREVLWESAVGADGNGLRWLGYTDNYIRVHASGPADLFNRVTSTQLKDAQPDGISGQIVSSR